MDTVVDDDMSFAIDFSLAQLDSLRETRRRTRAVIAELTNRLQPVSRALRLHQPPSVAAVAGQVHIALIAILACLCKWPDRRLAYRLVIGFELIGKLEGSGVLPTTVYGAYSSTGALVDAARASRVSSARFCSVEGKAFMVEAAAKLRTKNKASKLCSAAELDKLYSNEWAQVPSFVITQASGKKRLISNGKNRQNAATAWCEQITLCTASAPVLTTRAFVERAVKADIGPGKVQLESGGEDLPDAYLSLPALPEHVKYNIIEIVGADSISYSAVYALLFGFASSVHSFVRFSLFLQSCMRRLGKLPVSFFYDDCNIVDLVRAKGEGQALVQEFLKACGLAPPTRSGSNWPRRLFFLVSFTAWVMRRGPTKCVWRRVTRSVARFLHWSMTVLTVIS